MVDDKRKLKFDWTIKFSDLVLFLTLLVGALLGYFKLADKVNEHEIWIKEESRPFHQQTKDMLNALDKQQTLTVEQLKNLNSTMQEIKEEIKLYRYKR